MSPEASSARPLRVVLIDDHELIRSGLSRAFEREDGMEVVGTAGGIGQGLQVMEAQRPDVVVTDLELPDGTGIELVKTVRQRGGRVGLVVLTMHSGDDHIFAALEAGASAFVGKDAPAREVVSAARHAALSPRTFVCSGLAEAMMRRASDDRPRLSERERQVLDLLAEGLGTATIAGQLYMSESTVKTHIARIYQKFGATNRAQALVTAMRLGMLDGLRPQSR